MDSVIPVGIMTIKANGTYTFVSGAEHSGGNYTVACTAITFTGSPAGYSPGHASYGKHGAPGRGRPVRAMCFRPPDRSHTTPGESA